MNEERVRELERLLGRKALEVEILKEALELACAQQTELAVKLCVPGRFPVEVVADTLGEAWVSTPMRRSVQSAVPGSDSPNGTV